MKNIYNNVIHDAIMEMTMLAVCPSSEKTFGMAVLSALVKSGLFRNRCICSWLLIIHSFMTRDMLFVWVVSWR